VNEIIEEWGQCVNCFDEDDREMIVLADTPLLAKWSCPNCGIENLYTGKAW
jgi:hypothetical protein